MTVCTMCGAEIWLVDIPGFGTYWLTDKAAGLGSGVCPESEDGDWGHEPIEAR